MPKRDLSPESRERRDRPLQQQKSISDIIGPLVAQVNLDMTNESLDSMANINATTAAQESRLGSNGSSQQNRTEGDSLDNIVGHVVEESCVAADGDSLEADFTDVDGRIGDAVKAGKKAAKKAVKSVAKDIETVVHGSVQVARDAAGDIEDVVEGGLDMMAFGINKAADFGDLAGACVLQKQLSLEERPSNNVYISHPTKGAANMVPMGMHIRHHTFRNGSGQMVLMVEPGKLAEQAALKEGDVIIAVGEKDVSHLPLEDALHVFGYIDSTFSMTVIRSEQPDEGVDIPILVKKTITIEVLLNDDNIVAIKVLDITCTRLFYTASPRVVFQHKFGANDVPYFMQVHNNGLRMISHSDDKCNFLMHRYSDIFNGCTPCSIQNVTSDQALQINDTHTITLGTSTNLTNSGITADDRFFHLHTIGNQETLLESSLREGYFLAVDESSTTIGQTGTRTRQLIVCHHPYTNRHDLESIDMKYRFTKGDAHV